MDYLNKYLKYKGKYLKLKNQLEGGLIGVIPKEKLLETKDKYSVPEKINKYIKMITIPNTQIVRVGSSMNKIQPYFSDIDVMNIVERDMKTEEIVNWFIEELKKLLVNIELTENTFFSDFKAGGKHWKVDEIMAGVKDGLLLKDAIKIKDVVKVDIIGPYDERYLEMSTFFVLKSNEGYVNVNKEYFESLTESLLTDIKEFKSTKPFKAVKRMWSLSRINKNLEVLDKLKDLVKSNIALLAQINADLETIELLLEHDSNYDTNFIINELNSFKEKISSVLDLDIDQQKVDLMINNLIILFRNNENKENIIDMLKLLHDYLLNIINKETNEYLDHIGFSFPSDNDGILEKLKNIFF